MDDFDKQRLFEQFCAGSGPSLMHSWTSPDGTNVAIIQLYFHCALYVNPELNGGDVSYDHRYCYADLGVCFEAIKLFSSMGEWVYWQKDHCNQISVSGGYLYPNGAIHTPEFALGRAGWNEKDVARGIFNFFRHETLQSTP